MVTTVEVQIATRSAARRGRIFHAQAKKAAANNGVATTNGASTSISIVERPQFVRVERAAALEHFYGECQKKRRHGRADDNVR